eukprot:SAG22_NODE_817_length_7026_cov_13.636206_7_plen_59_part_00
MHRPAMVERASPGGQRAGDCGGDAGGPSHEGMLQLHLQAVDPRVVVDCEESNQRRARD